MDILLLVVGIACLLVGLAGAVLPLPGPPLSFGGLVMLHYSKYAAFDKSTLVTFFAVTLIISVLDYYVPIWGVKKFGGTSYGTWGSTIGLCLGFFVIPAVGIFLGSFLGAFIGELLGGMESPKALKAALGSFLGFLAGIFMKVVLCLAMIGVAGYQLFHYFF